MNDEEDFLNQLFRTFQAEAEEHFHSIRNQLLRYQRLEEEAERSPLLEAVFREAHNLKGSAATLGLEAVERLAHALEDKLAALRKKRLVFQPAQFDRFDEWIEDFGRSIAESSDRLRLMEWNPEPLMQWLEEIAEPASGIAAGEPPPVEIDFPPAAPDVAPLPESPAAFPPAAEAAAPASLPRKEVPAPAGSRKSEGGAGGDTMVRVATRKLDRLMLDLGELYIAHQQQGRQTGRVAEAVEDFVTALEGSATDSPAVRDLREAFGKAFDHLRYEYGRGFQLQEGLMDDLQESIKSLRLQPVESLFYSFQPMVFKLARQSQKQVQLVLKGTETEVDRQILEKLKDPLIHLIRNAIDHGLESPAERQEAGKRTEGRILISAANQGGFFIVEVSDDGRGMDPARLKRKAIEMGLLTEAAAETMGDSAAYGLVFTSGFSTREVADTTSGRGVGMDVLRSNIEALNGRIMIESAVGRGTTFRLRMPLTLAIQPALMIRAADEHYLFPLNALDRTIRLKGSEIEAAGGEWVEERKAIGLMALSDVLGLHADDRDPDRLYPVLVFSLGERRRAMVVDAIEGMIRVVVKPLAPPIRRVRFFSGGTLMSDGAVGLILNPADLLAVPIRVQEAIPAGGAPGAARLLIVDDAMTTITLERALLEHAGYRVDVALNGAQALRRLETDAYDLVLTDVEMPEIDGFALTRAIRGDARWRHLPVIIVSSRGSDEDRARGLEAGANAYVVKQTLDQQELLAAIRRLI